MKIIVCIKQVPDTDQVKIDPVRGTLIREGVPSIINPDDKNALEEALRIKDKYKDVKVIAISMGPPQAEVALIEAVAMGADEAYLLTDKAFSGSDTYVTAKVLAAGIKYIGDYDLIFCGRQSLDGETAQVGPQLAERLGIPQITNVVDLKLDGRQVIAKRAVEDGYFTIKANMPVLITATRELNKPRYPSIKGIYEGYKGDRIHILSFENLNLNEDEVGLKASPTNVLKTFAPTVDGREVEFLEGSPREQATNLIVRLKEKNLI